MSSSEEIKKTITDAFKLFDKEEKGVISIDKLSDIMQALGQTPSHHELREACRQLDADREGVFDLETFQKLMENMLKDELHRNEVVLETFRIMDKDGDGYLGARDIREVLKSLQWPGMPVFEVEKMLKEADYDGDGKVDYEDFKRLISYNANNTNTE